MKVKKKKYKLISKGLFLAKTKNTPVTFYFLVVKNFYLFIFVNFPFLYAHSLSLSLSHTHLCSFFLLLLLFYYSIYSIQEQEEEKQIWFDFVPPHFSRSLSIRLANVKDIRFSFIPSLIFFFFFYSMPSIFSFVCLLYTHSKY